MSEGGSRRAVAEIRFGEDRSGIAKVGGRSIHQYWSLLSPHFRDVLLAPQRRSDDGGVSWTWREALDKKPLTAVELAGVRKRLERANESFAENPVNPLMADDRSGTSSQALVDQVAAKVKSMAESMAAKSDMALADFVCRTEQGAMVHSWGVASPAQIHYPDTMESGVSGVVLVGGKPAPGHEIVIENAKGLSVARAQSDQSGEFIFSKIVPGRYRVRVTSGRVKFSVKGSMVTVERGTVVRLEMASTNSPDEPDESTSKGTDVASSGTSSGSMASATKRKRGRSAKTATVILVLLLLGGGVWVWRAWFASDQSGQRVTTQTSSMTPEAFAADEKKTDASTTVGGVADDGGRLLSSADGMGHAKPKAANPNVSFDRSTAKVAGGERGPATIGSRVDVLSGVAGAANIAGGKTGGGTGLPLGLPESSTAQQSFETSDSVVQGTRPEMKPANAKGKNIRVAVAAPSAAGALPQASTPRASASGMDAGGDNNSTADGQAAPAINMPSIGKVPPARTAGASSGPAANGAPSPETASSLGSGASSTDGEPSGVVDKTSLGEAQNAGPRVTTAETQKNLAKKPTKPDASSNELQSGDSQAGADKNDAHSSHASRDKRTEKGSKAASTSAQNSSPGEASSPTTAPTDAQAGAKSDEVMGSAEGTKSEDPGPAAAGQTSSEQSKANLGKNSESSSKNPSKNEVTTQAETKPSTGDKADAPATEPEAGARASSDGVADPANSGATDLARVTLKVRAIAWKPRLIRDAIVPTLPVRVGESDAADLSRELLLKEKRDGMPETFRAPVIYCGLTLQIDPAAGGRVMHWDGESLAQSVKGSVKGDRVDLVWLAGQQVFGSRVLTDAAGLQIARVVFAPDGSAQLELIGKTQAVFWVGVNRSPKDDRPNTGQKAARFAWTILRGAAPHLSWSDDDVWPGGRGARMTILLDQQSDGRVVVALVDRVTGWSLSGEL